MPEHRGRKHHQDRVAETLRIEIGAMIEGELVERMGVRHVPELSFLADRSGRFQSRIEELMDRSRKRNKARAEEKPSPEPAAPLE